MKEVKIVVDKRTELMSVLLYISNYRKEYPDLLLFNKDIEYVKDVSETFSKFAKHKAVVLLNEIVEKLNFQYDAPYILATQLNEDFSVGNLLEYPYRSRLQSSAVVLNFLNQIKDFAEKSCFEKFYHDHENIYKRYIDKVKASTDFEQLSHFEEFFKIDTKRNYVVNLLPLEARAGAYYDYRDDSTFVAHFRSDYEDEFGLVDKGVTNRIFKIFTLCLLRNLIEKNDIKVPNTKEFSKILKSQFITINNVQYICEEIKDILRILFQKSFLNIEDDVVKEKLDAFKTEDKHRVYKTYEILQDWQKSNDQIDKYLQQIFDLYR